MVQFLSMLILFLCIFFSNSERLLDICGRPIIWSIKFGMVGKWCDERFLPNFFIFDFGAVLSMLIDSMHFFC